MPYVLAYRGSVHDSTASTLYKVLSRWEIVLPIDIVLKLKTLKTLMNIFQSYWLYLSTFVAAVKRHQARPSERHEKLMAWWPISSTILRELVWVQNRARKQGLCPKLQRRYMGPFRVVKRVTDVRHQLMLVRSDPECVVHLYGALYFFFDSHKWSSLPESWPARSPAN